MDEFLHDCENKADFTADIENFRNILSLDNCPSHDNKFKALSLHGTRFRVLPPAPPLGAGRHQK